MEKKGFAHPTSGLVGVAIHIGDLWPVNSSTAQRSNCLRPCGHGIVLRWVRCRRGKRSLTRSRGLPPPCCWPLTESCLVLAGNCRQNSELSLLAGWRLLLRKACGVQTFSENFTQRAQVCARNVSGTFAVLSAGKVFK